MMSTSNTAREETLRKSLQYIEEITCFASQEIMRNSSMFLINVALDSDVTTVKRSIKENKKNNYKLKDIKFLLLQPRTEE